LIDVPTVVLMLTGAAFMLLSAVGVVRMPDVYMRLQVASKASSLGAGFLMLGVAVHFGEMGIIVRAILVVAFIFLTTPVSAHLIGRAAYITGVPLWHGTGADELRGRYDADRLTLEAPGPEATLAAGAVPGGWPEGEPRSGDTAPPWSRPVATAGPARASAQPGRPDDGPPARSAAHPSKG
jgi:multicomponent Na+:H+ antiporter subunit G